MSREKAIVATLLFAGAIALSCYVAVWAVIALVEVVSELVK